MTGPGKASEFFGPDGRLAGAHEGYEYRPGQVEMARSVEQMFARGGSLMIEAATGTGKTLAYLVPALAAGRRVIVSTGTRNLQDQIYEKDVPFLRERAGMEISACVMKGRDNYLCRYTVSDDPAALHYYQTPGIGDYLFQVVRCYDNSVPCPMKFEKLASRYLICICA